MLTKILTRLCLLSVFLLGGGLQVLLAQPDNDACANATSLVCGAAAINGTTVGTVAEAASPGGCSSRYGVWYTFTGDGSISTITSTTTFDHAIYVATGACGALTNVSCTDGTTVTETTSFSTTVGTKYYIYIAYFSPTGTSIQTGTFTIARACLTPPANDLCAGAISLTMNANCSPTTGSTAGATDNNQTGDCVIGTENSVWYKFVATGPSALITVDGDAGFDPVIGALSACGATTRPSGGDCTDATLDGGIETMTLTGLTSGSTYYIQVHDYGGDALANSTFTICVSVPPAPPNCATLNTPVNGATGVPLGSALTWTAPASGSAPTAYKVYIGPLNPPTTLTATVDASTTTYSYPLAYSTTYFWYVVPTNIGGNAVGCNATVFSFTTQAPPPAPGNDDCATATVLTVQPNVATGCPNAVSGTTVSATPSATPASATFPSASDDDVWYEFTATQTAQIVRLCNVTYSIVAASMGIGLHAGCAAANTEITGITITTNNGAGTAILNGLTIGATYKLRVLTNGTISRANFDISIVETPAPPLCATLVSPANNATNVALNTPLTWTAPASGGAPTGYKVYFGTVNPPTTLVTAVTAPTTSYTPTTTYNTTYYWYVVPTNSGGDAVGCNTPVFTFTTSAAPTAPAFDECAGAISITNGAAQFINPGTQSVQGATQSLAPINCNGAGTSTTAVDVWYKFTTDANGGDVSISIVPTTSIDIVVQAFTTAGMCSGASVCADANGGAGPLTNGGEKLVMTGLSGSATYYFRLYRFNITNALYSINVSAASGTALPLELKSFTGQVTGNVNRLNWETLSEKNVQFHVVERSIDGQRWLEVGRVNGKGDSQVSTTYSLTDNAPLSRAYYRLRSVDFDGKENLSHSIVLTRKGDQFGITSVYPSPTTSNVTVQFNSTSEEQVTVRVMDMTGRLVMQQVMEAVKDINELPIVLTGLQAGVHSVTVSNSTSVSTPVRFVKQ